MDKEVFKQKLEAVLPDAGYDSEIAHGRAEDILVTALEDLGYDCTRFKNGNFWYA
jgi:hypothetical protein